MGSRATDRPVGLFTLYHFSQDVKFMVHIYDFVIYYGYYCPICADCVLITNHPRQIIGTSKMLAKPKRVADRRWASSNQENDYTVWIFIPQEYHL